MARARPQTAHALRSSSNAKTRESQEGDCSNSSDSLGEVHWKNCIRAVATYRDRCARAKDYESAAVAEARFQDLKRGEAQWRKEKMWRQEMDRVGLSADADATRIALVESHSTEQRIFAQEWCNKLQDFDVQARKLEKDFLKWQSDERRAQNFDSKPQGQWRPTKKVMELKKQAAALAKSERYAEAAKAKQAMEQFEARERDAWESKTEEHPATRFAFRQHAELQSFQAKLQARREKLAAEQQAELDQLMQRQTVAKRKQEGELGRLRICSGDTKKEEGDDQHVRTRRAQSRPTAGNGARSRPASAPAGSKGTRVVRRPHSAVGRVTRPASRPTSAAFPRKVFSTAATPDSAPIFRGR